MVLHPEFQVCSGNGYYSWKYNIFRCQLLTPQKAWVKVTVWNISVFLLGKELAVLLLLLYYKCFLRDHQYFNNVSTY